MKLADGLVKHGFRKWYERELMHSHAHLTLCLLCTIGIVMALEAAMRFHAWSDQLTDLGALVACTGVGLWSLRRYVFLLHHAEAAAHQAECAECGTYGRLTLVRRLGDEGQGADVRCNHCQREWRIDL